MWFFCSLKIIRWRLDLASCLAQSAFAHFPTKLQRAWNEKEADLPHYLFPSSSHPPSSCSSCPLLISLHHPPLLWDRSVGRLGLTVAVYLWLTLNSWFSCFLYLRSAGNTHAVTTCGLQATEFLMARDKGHCLLEFSLKLQSRLYMYLNVFKFLLKCANCTYWRDSLRIVLFAEMPGELYTRMRVMWHPHMPAECSHQIQPPWSTPPQSLVMPS